MDQKKIGSFLKELRKEKGITQEELAQHLGVSSRSVSRWETGSNMPDISLLPVIADFYGVDIREIIEGERKDWTDGEQLEVAEKMADYAGAEKSSLFRWVRIFSLIGTVLLTAALVFQCIRYEPDPVRFGAIIFTFLGLVALAVMSLYANGILGKLARNKAAAAAVKVAVIVLLVVGVRFLLSAAFVLGLGLLESRAPAETKTGIEAYDKAQIVAQYAGDLDSGLFVFPDEMEGALEAEFESSLKTGLFDTDGSIILDATYTPEAFRAETERLSQITCTVFDTIYADSDYHIGRIMYDTQSYRYPAYVASDGFDYVYEYALIDEEHCRIVYVLLSYPQVPAPAGAAYADFLKKDTGAYDIAEENVLERFSIYSYRFSGDAWSEYSPEDAGRVTAGEPR